MRVHLENPWQEETWGAKRRDTGSGCGEEPSWDRLNRSGAEGTERKGHGLFPEHNHSETSLQRRTGRWAAEARARGPQRCTERFRRNPEGYTEPAWEGLRERPLVEAGGWTGSWRTSVQNSCYNSPRRNGLNQGWPQTSRHFWDVWSKGTTVTRGHTCSVGSWEMRTRLQKHGHWEGLCSGKKMRAWTVDQVLKRDKNVQAGWPIGLPFCQSPRDRKHPWRRRPFRLELSLTEHSLRVWRRWELKRNGLTTP